MSSHPLRNLCALVVILGRAALSFGQTGDGTLTVKTDPEGIEVWIDDKYIGDSPIADKKLKPGRYSLKLVDPVQKSSSIEDVFVQAGQVTVVEKKMEGKFGSLKVTTDPEGADVLVLTNLGKAPVSNDFMNPGKYRLEIRHQGRGYLPAVQDIVIPRGQTVSVTKTLEKKSLLDNKAIARLALGAGAIGGFVWAVVAQGEHRYFEVKGPAYRDLAQSLAVQRTLGIIIGSICVVGFEIVAFF